MTNADYILSRIGFAPSNTNTIEAALLDYGMTSATVYDPANKAMILPAIIQVINILLTTADTRQGEGGSSLYTEIKYDRPSLLKLLALIQDEAGILSGRPVISGVNVW